MKHLLFWHPNPTLHQEKENSLVLLLVIGSLKTSFVSMLFRTLHASQQTSKLALSLAIHLLCSLCCVATQVFKLDHFRTERWLHLLNFIQITPLLLTPSLEQISVDETFLYYLLPCFLIINENKQPVMFSSDERSDVP